MVEPLNHRDSKMMESKQNSHAHFITSITSTTYICMGPKLIWWTFYLRSMFVQIIEFFLHFLCHFVHVKSLTTPDASFYALKASFRFCTLECNHNCDSKNIFEIKAAPKSKKFKWFRTEKNNGRILTNNSSTFDAITCVVVGSGYGW